MQGSTTGFDSWADTRTRNESRVALEYNAGYTSALAAFEELTSPTWPQCLQGFGYFSKVLQPPCAHLAPSGMHSPRQCCHTHIIALPQRCYGAVSCVDTLCVPCVQDVVCG